MISVNSGGVPSVEVNMSPARLKQQVTEVTMSQPPLEEVTVTVTASQVLLKVSSVVNISPVVSL